MIDLKPATIGVSIAVLLFVGGFVGYLFPHPDVHQIAVANRIGGYQFVNPLLTCGFAEDEPYAVFGGLQQKLRSQIDLLKKSGDVDRVSVYFRDMNYGTWTGVNPEDTFIPASLMKVPLLLAYLKQSERDPALFSKKYAIQAGAHADDMQFFKPKVPLVSGTYAVDQLLRALVVGSDNNANIVLHQQIPAATLSDVYNTLDLPAGEENDETMSTKDYMILFRVLYNATYLSRSKSQEALEMLSNAEFKEGIVAGINGTTVSHKFGERSEETQDASGDRVITKRELHDCGIVYYPGSPYGLCIMTEGSDFSKMTQAIAGLSSIVYGDVRAGLLKQK